MGRSKNTLGTCGALKNTEIGSERPAQRKRELPAYSGLRRLTLSFGSRFQRMRHFSAQQLDRTDKLHSVDNAE